MTESDPVDGLRVVEVEPSPLKWVAKLLGALAMLLAIGGETYDDGTRWRVQRRSRSGWVTLSEHRSRYSAELELKRLTSEATE